MTVSGVLITHQLSSEAIGWFQEARRVVDELVVFVDEQRATPGLQDQLQSLDACIHATTGPAFYQLGFSEMLRACQGDWILKIDFDERLSGQWQDPRWRELLDSGEFTHFYAPRRWLVAPDRYITSAPWWPDWQLRLFRNEPSRITFPSKLHENLIITGQAGFLRTLAIEHHELRTSSRAAREAKADAYERAQPGAGLGFYYLHEDCQPAVKPLPENGRLDLSCELLLMERMPDTAVSQVGLEVERSPAEAAAPCALFWVPIRLTNNSSLPLASGSPHPLNVSYHWRVAPSRDMVVFDGFRTGLPEPIAPGESYATDLFVVAPEWPGRYILEITLVQEGVRWLEVSNPALISEYFVTVSE